MSVWMDWGEGEVRGMGVRGMLVVVAMVCAARANAQVVASAAGTGSVSGHVVCGDTQRPARFAHVVLFGVPAAVSDTLKVDPAADAASQMKAMSSAMKALGGTSMVQVQTGTDGVYTATDVAPGDYYLFAAAPGYVSPTAQVQALYAAGADPKKTLPGVPIVHVRAEHPSSGDVTMVRGASISGTVLWDDGAPVSGAMMRVVPAKGEEDNAPPQFGMLAMAGMLNSLMNISDDQGHFRLAGLPPGEYVVQATIQEGQQTGLGGAMNLAKLMSAKPLVVYAPAAFHKADAKTVTLHGDQEVRDQQVTLNLGGLHTVSGHVTSVEDHHGVNSGVVKLQDVKDKDFVRSASLDAAGGFRVTFVPPGTYDLIVADAEDTEPAKKTGKEKNPMSALLGGDSKTIRSYKEGRLSVIVSDTDLNGQDVALMVEKNPQEAPDLSKIFSGDDEEKGTPSAPPPPPQI